MNFGISPACWHHYDQGMLIDLIESHPFLFPNFIRPSQPFTPAFANMTRKDTPYVDDFGCTWQTTDDGIVGTVVSHPLNDWIKWKDYTFPDPSRCMGRGPIDWKREQERIDGLIKQGELAVGGLRHGHTFLQLCDIRGFQNLIFDFADEAPLIWKLINGIEAFNAEIIRRYLELGVDMMSYGEDLGMQIGPMISPEYFVRYIKPSYHRLMEPARKKGIPVHMHSDGDIRALAAHLIDGGVEILNIQDMVNGIDWIADNFAGKICIELDIDRQFITAKGTPEKIDALILEEVRKIGRKEGGLMMVYGLYPGIPMENVKALMDSMEKYAFYFT